MMPLQTLPSTDLEHWLKLSWDAIVAHYHEIALKGGNRSLFVQALHQNLERALAPLGVTVRNYFDRMLVQASPDRFLDALQAVAQVFGIAYVSPVHFLPRDIDAIVEAGVQAYRLLAEGNNSFSVRVRRVDKTFPFTSNELERLIGQRIVQLTGAPVNLDAPDILLSFRIYEDVAYLLGPKVQGVGGLPVGTMGQVLTLFSGGIDSPVAAWLIMKRGCHTDFVHFHVFRSAEEVRDTKIPSLVERLIRPQGLTAKLFLVPYHPFQLALLTAKVPQALELVLFRRFMVGVANQIAQEHGHQALVTGDNLGQVASQTMENLVALDDATIKPIFRPLLTDDKQDIVSLAKRIGTYELSIQSYKDCCSLIARHPEIHPKLNFVQAAEAALPLDYIVKMALVETEVWTIGENTTRTIHQLP